MRVTNKKKRTKITKMGDVTKSLSGSKLRVLITPGRAELSLTRETEARMLKQGSR